MFYLFNGYEKDKYWAEPFNNLLKCLFLIFKKKNINCNFTEGGQINDDDIIIIISGVIDYVKNNFSKNKIIIINSESICLGVKSLPYLNSYINNPNLLEVWDYSKKNINKFKQITDIKVHYFPLTYHSYFESMYNLDLNKKKDIDICLYGCQGPKDSRRSIILDKFRKDKYNVFAGSVENNIELGKILSRSKIVIIIHYYKDDLCIDYYRLYGLLSNKIFTIHEKPSDDQMEESMNKILFVDYDNLFETCKKYLEMSQDDRDKITVNIFNWWKEVHPIEKYIPNISN